MADLILKTAEPSPLTEAQLAELRAALEAKRASLLRTHGMHGQRIPDDAERPVEEGELAKREMAISDSKVVGAHQHRLLEAVEAALAAMHAGTYGRSVLTGDPIPFSRLQAIPWARTNSDD